MNSNRILNIEFKNYKGVTVMKKKSFLMFLFNTVLIIVLPNATMFAQNSFFKPSRLNYQVGGFPWGVVSADFNNDNNPDIVTCSRSERSVTILLGNGDGTFKNRTDFDVGISPRSVVAIDFNNDGNIDLAAANLLSDNISVLIGNGDGTFQDSVNYPSGIATRFIISDDFNNDDIPDLAAANRDDGTISIFIGLGDGTFESAQHILVPNNFNPRQITSVDFDNDTYPDIAAVHDDQSSMPVARAVYFKNNGDGTFSSGTELTLSLQGKLNESVSIASNDFNLDGNFDLVVGIDEPQMGYLNILFGNGDGTFKVPQIFYIGRGPFAVEATDMNNDSYPDLVCLAADQKSISVHMNKTNGTFTNELPPDIFDLPNHYVVGEYPRFLTSADVNNDQNTDILIDIEDAGEVAVLLGNGDSTFVVADEYRVGIPPQSFPMEGLSEDFNNDGNLDLAVANWGYPNDSSVVTILYGAGNGTFPDSADYLAGINPEDIDKGDFNNDNITDLVIANERDSLISILYGKPDGTFNQAVAVNFGNDPQLSLRYYPDLCVADFNNDDEEDIAVINRNQQKVHLIFGDGSGGFSNPVFINTPSRPELIKTEDFNNDNNSDIAVMNAEFGGINQISVYLGDGTGGFSQPIITPITTNLLYHFNFAFLDDDNFIDMMAVDGEENKIFIFEGIGNGSFNLSNTLDVFDPASVYAFDLNSDGKNDMAITSTYSSEVVIYIGEGMFNYTRLSESFGTQGGAYRIIQGDFDNDDDVDLAVTKGIFGYGSVSILLNQLNITNVDDNIHDNIVIDKLELYQNYPNPFNPTTSIQYAVSSLPDGKAGRQFVSLKVYDILGNEVATLVNEEMKAGNYQVEFDGKNLSSGIYFCSLIVGNRSVSRKMILLK
jgi:hypothetical protein